MNNICGNQPVECQHFIYDLNLSSNNAVGALTYQIKHSNEQISIAVNNRNNFTPIQMLNFEGLQRILSVIIAKSKTSLTDNRLQLQQTSIIAKHLTLVLEIHKIASINTYRQQTYLNGSLQTSGEPIQHDMHQFKTCKIPHHAVQGLLLKQVHYGFQILGNLKCHYGEQIAAKKFLFLHTFDGTIDGTLLMEGRTALHFAALAGEIDSIITYKKLLRTRKYIEALQQEDSKGFAPIDYIKASLRIAQLCNKLPTAAASEINEILTARRVKYNQPAFQKMIMKLSSRKDLFGRTGLHWSAIHGDFEAIKEIISTPAGIRGLLVKDIFGYTPPDLAAMEGHSNLAAIWNQTSTASMQSRALVFKSPIIDQKTQMKKFHQYFEIQNRDLLFMNQYLAGLCNGASFLYTLQENDDCFYSQLEALVSWDGSKSTLHNGLESLFESKIAELHWFQSSIDHRDQDEQSLAWLQRQLLILNPEMTLKPVHEASQIEYNPLQLATALETYRKMDGINLFIGGCGHAVSLKIRKGKFHYFDANLPYRTAALETAFETAKIIAATKYRMLNHSDEPMQMSIYAYYIKPH